jgi:hypothetical protein
VRVRGGREGDFSLPTRGPLSKGEFFGLESLGRGRDADSPGPATVRVIALMALLAGTLGPSARDPRPKNRPRRLLSGRRLCRALLPGDASRRRRTSPVPFSRYCFTLHYIALVIYSANPSTLATRHTLLGLPTSHSNLLLDNVRD